MADIVFENQNRREKIIIATVFSLFLAILFGLKDVLILMCSKWSHLYPVVNTNVLTFEEVYNYLPYTIHFSLDNPLPAAPLALENYSKFTFYPAFTLIFTGFIYKYLCFSNVDLYLFVMHTIFSILSFWLLVAIYKKYISLSWSILLSFLGVTFFNKFSSLQYWWQNLLSFKGLIDNASMLPLEITRTPVPSLTFSFFLLCFYLSIKTYKISVRRYIFLTVLWSLNLYIYLHNFIAGIIFWYCYICFINRINNERVKWKELVRTYLIVLVITLLISLPIIIKYIFLITPFDIEISKSLGVMNRNSGIIFNQWGWFISYVLPVLLVILVVLLYCADYYELFYRFTPLFIMMVVEFLVINIHMILGGFVQPDLFLIRIGNFFLRFLYFVPFIYFFTMPFKRLFHNNIHNMIANRVHSILNLFAVRMKMLIIIIGIAGISTIVIASNIKNYRHHNIVTSERMEKVSNRLNELLTSNSSKGTVVSEDIAVNLLVPILSKNTTLLVNSFNNYIDRESITDRLVLFAKIYGWSREQFISFMMRNVEYEIFGKGNNFIIDDKTLNIGFGYMLVWHKRAMGVDELKAYEKELINKFENINLQVQLKKYDIKAIQAFDGINDEIKVKSITKNEDTNIYILD